ncbi:uncharacterized protein LOC126478878 isoform X3 [Schistocerca serialis cubense]|uniref:uncharacterized protein LOC126478878 isoform X3 n=1 Tax=Schistocerca serialis cubense TaxID=2023355 RepID=UPI00214E04DB|nr:uncharacterized protein LOC126478878 isoform X3 [Schistocerca serialis cubense]
MQALLLFTVASLAAMAASEAPSTSYGAPFRQPQRIQTQPQQQPQAFAQSQAQPSFAAPQSFSGFSAALFRPQFFIPAQDSSRLTDIYRLPTFTTSAPTTTEAATTTTEAPTTTVAAPYNYGKPELREAEESGVYYVLQPDGRLQRIAYAHGPAPISAAPEQQRAYPGEPSALQQPAVATGYLARFAYQDLHPAGAPIYSYKQPELVRIN